MDELFAALVRSKFRSRFRLSGKEAEYFRDKGLATILQHARDFVTKRLADAEPPGICRSARNRHLLPGLPGQVAPHSERQAAHARADRLYRRGFETLAGRAGHSTAGLPPGMTLLNIVRKKTFAFERRAPILDFCKIRKM